MQRAHEVAHVGAEDALHRPRLGRNDMDLDLAGAQRRRDLEPDEARADHDRALGILGIGDDGAGIVERTQDMDMPLAGAGNRQPHRLGAGREQQAVVRHGLAVGERDMAGLGVDRSHIGRELQVDLLVRIETLRPQRHPFLRRAAGEIILREIGPIDRRRRVVGEHGDLAAVAVTPQHLGRGKAGRAAADDDDALRRIGRRLLRLRRVLLLRDEDAALTLLDLPARQRRQRRRAHRLAGAQIETGVMPGAADVVAGHEPIGERTVIMAAMRIDREDLGARAHQQHLLLADMAKQHVVLEIVGRDAEREIGTSGRVLVVGHVDVLLRCR